MSHSAFVVSGYVARSTEYGKVLITQYQEVSFARSGAEAVGKKLVELMREHPADKGWRVAEPMAYELDIEKLSASLKRINVPSKAVGNLEEV